MVYIGPELIVSQVRQHDDSVCPNPIGEHRHGDGDHDEHQAFPERTKTQVGIQRSACHGGDKVSQATARLDYRPAAGRNLQVIAFPVHGHAA
jgi:hypothetical protein